MKTKTLLLFFCASIFFSCKGIRSDDSSVINIEIDNTNVPKLFDISKKIKDIQLIPLKETNGNYIGGIYKIFEVENHFVIFDRINTHKINLYDSNGVFVKNIIKVGDGKDDALNIVDCWINDREELEVYDYAQKQVYSFDKQYNLKSITKAKNPAFLNSMIRIGNTNNYLAYSDYNSYNPPHAGKFYNFLELDSSMNIQKTYLNYDKKFIGLNILNFTNQFFKHNNSLIFTRSFDTNIYGFSDGEFKKVIKLNYRSKPIPEDFLNDIVDKNFAILMSRNTFPDKKAQYFKDYATFYGSWYENNANIFIKSINNDNQTFVSMLDKKTYKEIGNGNFLSETKNFKVRLPYFQSYNPKTNTFLSTILGNDSKYLLLANSPLKSKITGSPEQLYIIKTIMK